MKLISTVLLGLMSSFANAHQALCGIELHRNATFFAQLNHPSEALGSARLDELPYLSSVREVARTADRNFLIALAQKFKLTERIAYRPAEWIELAGEFFEVTPGPGLKIRRMGDHKVVLDWALFHKLPNSRLPRPVFARDNRDILHSIKIYDSETAFAVLRNYLRSVVDETESAVLDAEFMTRAEFTRWLSQHMDSING